MKNYVVYCSINAVSAEFEETLSKLAPKLLKLQDNLWIATSSLTPDEIVDELVKFLNVSVGEKVFVFEITENYDASFGKYFIDGQVKPN